MPCKNTPKKALTKPQLLRWLDQVATDPELSPIVSRAAIKLAKIFANKTTITLKSEDLGRLLGVSKLTAFRALAKMRERGHLNAKGSRGYPLEFSPNLREEGE